MSHKTLSKIRKRASETGSALVYILIAIALLAALTVSFMDLAPACACSSERTSVRRDMTGTLAEVAANRKNCSYSVGSADSTAPTNTIESPNSHLPIL